MARLGRERPSLRPGGVVGAELAGAPHVSSISPRPGREPEFGAERVRIARAMEIANAVTVARGRLRMNQDELATEMRMTRSAISRLESGRHLPGLDTLQRLSDALDLVFEIGPGGSADEPERDLYVVSLSRLVTMAADDDESWAGTSSSERPIEERTATNLRRAAGVSAGRHVIRPRGGYPDRGS
jgi:transcriptional regulator with XRE-family HTH domain